MVRTQIYLTEEERAGLAALAKSMDKKQSEVIREAVDRFLEQARGSHRNDVVREVGGLWKNRKDLPDFAEARRSWNRD